VVHIKEAFLSWESAVEAELPPIQDIGVSLKYCGPLEQFVITVRDVVDSRQRLESSELTAPDSLFAASPTQVYPLNRQATASALATWNGLEREQRRALLSGGLARCQLLETLRMTYRTAQSDITCPPLPSFGC
jgi:hypothetical protein